MVLVLILCYLVALDRCFKYCPVSRDSDEDEAEAEEDGAIEMLKYNLRGFNENY